MGNSLDLCLLQKKKGKSSDLWGSSRRLLLGDEDRLSVLPDDILLVILSFLTLKEVLKTSLLSRRWMNLWMCTPVLDFLAPVSYDSVDDMERQEYVEWVNDVLRRHKGECLKEFKIVCDLDISHQEDIDSWVKFALSRKVEYLELNLMAVGYHVANLHNNYVFPGEFPEFDSKCLKSLSLKNLEVTGEAINFFLLNCPFLERLEVLGAGELTNLVVSGPGLALRFLRIRFCRGLEVLEISNFNLVSLEIPSVRDLTLTDLPMLGDLSISHTRFNPGHALSQASSCHSQLEALTLHGLQLKDIPQLSNLDQLTKLRRLVIQVDACRDESLTVLVSTMNSCPRLEEFVLRFLWCDPQRTNRSILEVERSSSSLKNESLKVLELLGYYGRVSDIELVIHMMESAVCLEKIIVDPRRSERLEWRYYSETNEEQEARRCALKQFKDLGKSKSMPSHVHVLIR